ncbi:ABC transporter permease [Pseudonocardia kunmingensis]|uniref:Osmoprotectant transport system permease protein n=1 Tax=Pseudonocardia kunmingensis TaxID=630975 RepID=A0A543E0K6_9PSEU|nr:ABC transporter permease [Pseudonocardia kunmingensis]TQM15102.1 osmoprotectant transport system permease protein [Pseudonocardia kunmingensis]
MIWSWIPANADRILDLTVEHLRLALIPVVVGLVLSVPLGWLANHYRVARAVLVPAAGVLYTIPSLTLFVVLPGILGTRILSEINIIVALTIYTVALLVRSVADALAAVPGLVVAAATAMGYRPARRFLDVELPLAVPVLVAGLRVATVSSISLVSVGALIGVGGLGEFFTEGFQLQFPTEIITGIGLIVLLALAGDAVLLLLGRVLTPWSRAGGAR